MLSWVTLTHTPLVVLRGIFPLSPNGADTSNLKPLLLYRCHLSHGALAFPDGALAFPRAHWYLTVFTWLLEHSADTGSKCDATTSPAEPVTDTLELIKYFGPAVPVIVSD